MSKMIFHMVEYNNRFRKYKRRLVYEKEKRQINNNLSFLLYYISMLSNGEKLGAFIVPTGIGAKIGGYAGDASSWARKFASASKLIVNPNVVNAGCFSGITDNMFYVEGYSLDEFFKGNLNLVPSQANKIGVVFDKAIPDDVLNIHINTMRAVSCVYGIDIIGYEITENFVGVDFELSDNGVSNGSVADINTLLEASKKLISKGADAIALVCMFEDPEELNIDYANGIGTDPVGGVEAILSHYISKELCVPCAHSPAFADYQISSELVDAKAASEYITPTFLPCVLLGLSKAPKLSRLNGINVKNLDYLLMPYDCLGCTPVFEAVKNNIKILVIKENETALNITAESLDLQGKICVFESYEECFKQVLC